MNKITTIITIAAVLLAGACTKTVVEFDSSPVTLDYSVNLDNAVTKSLGDGSTVDMLAYAIYEEQSDVAYAKGTIDKTDGKFTFKPSLYIGKEYDIVLFAYKNSSYDINNLQAVTRSEGLIGENADAFSLKETVKIDKDENLYVNGASKGSFRNPRTVELTRPFAQLNIGTSSVDDLAAVGAAKVKVTISDYKTSYNVRTSLMNGETTYYEYTTAIAEVKENTFDIEGNTYSYVSLNYLFPVGNVNATVTVLTAEDDVIRTISFDNLPLKTNSKTNIYGNLVKGELTFNVSVETGFTTPDENKEVPANK